MIKSKPHKTICSYCGVGCGILVNQDSNGKITVEGDVDYPVNKGMLCSKGMNLNYVAQETSDRILHPEMRWSKNHPMQKVSWDEALDRAAAVFKSIIEKHQGTISVTSSPNKGSTFRITLPIRQNESADRQE